VAFDTLELDQLKGKPFRVVHSPGLSVVVIAADMVGAGRGLPREWMARARAELRPEDLCALAPLGDRPGEASPAVFTMNMTDGLHEVSDELERIATLPVDELLDSLVFACGSTLPQRWHGPVRQPRRWLVSYARALGRLWEGIRSPWAAAAALLDRETERIETAAAHEAFAELFSTLHHRASLVDGVWRVPMEQPMQLHVSDAGLSLTPMLAGPGATRTTVHDDGRLSHIAYPLPGIDRLLAGDFLPPAAALDALLGAPRANVLRLLDRPHLAGQLARSLFMRPSGMTHHLKALEAAGLILRERVGREVVVHRTSRGGALLALYETG